MVSSSSTLSSPCCPSGSLGGAAKHPEGSGQWIVAEGREGRPEMEIYAAGADLGEAERIVVIFTDVFGVRSGYHRSIADVVAKTLSGEKKVGVIVPDLFRGKPALRPWFEGKFGTLFDVLPMVYRIKYVYNFEATVKRDICGVLLPFLKSKVNLPKVGISCVGFCYGGWVFGKLIETLAESEEVVRCCVGIHPSWNLEAKLFDGSEISMAKNCGTTPVLLMPAGNDSDGIKPGGDAVAILSSARGNLEHTNISIEFPDMKHGWVTRDVLGEDNSVQRRDQEQAIRLCCDFIRTHHK